MNQHLCPFSMRPCKAWSQNHLRDLTLNRVEVGNEKKKKDNEFEWKYHFFSYTLERKGKPVLLLSLKKSSQLFWKSCLYLRRHFDSSEIMCMCPLKSISKRCYQGSSTSRPCLLSVVSVTYLFKKGGLEVCQQACVMLAPPGFIHHEVAIICRIWAVFSSGLSPPAQSRMSAD